MSENHPQTAAELNAATDAALTAKAADAATPVKTARPRRTAKVAKPAPVAKTGRRALTPKERAARPATSTIQDYVKWLNKNVFEGKLSKAQISAAEVSITLYGAYQVSPERRAARLGK